MTGKQEYEQRILRKIQCTLDRNEDYLKGYYNFVGINKTLDTRYNYILCVSMFMEKIGKNITELTIDDFTEYINNLAMNKSSSYAIKTYAALKIFGKYLYVRKILSYNPMEGVERPKYKETKEMLEKQEKGFLTKEELIIYQNQVFAGVGSKKAMARQENTKARDLLIIKLLLCTGMRCSALMKLDIDDINLNTMIISVYDKGDKINLYQLPTSLKYYIKDWLIERERFKLPDDVRALFISERKQRMSQWAIAQVVNKYAQNIKGKNITPHKLRATYGTQIYEATHDLYYTQLCMNHSSPKTTERYIRGQKDNKQRAADILGELI